MRIYVNSGLSTLWDYVKAIVAIAVLTFLLTYAFRAWKNEPIFQDILKLLDTHQTEQTQPAK
jgi:RNAse (barnase) inhibitor barstar